MNYSCLAYKYEPAVADSLTIGPLLTMDQWHRDYLPLSTTGQRPPCLFAQHGSILFPNFTFNQVVDKEINNWLKHIDFNLWSNHALYGNNDFMNFSIYINTSEKQMRYIKARELLQQWIEDKSDYDKTTWPIIEKNLKQDEISIPDVL